MHFIQSASTISHQPAFRSHGFAEKLDPLKVGSEIIAPDYKQYINPVLLRRMSKILRMAVSCSIDSLEQAGVKSPDAIIVGTGLGCLDDTEKFLNNFITIQDGLLPPTSFIQSTHNTVAGQISLLLQNHHYNMTHTQNTVSFEHALLDACLCIDEGKQNILVGAADEFIPILNTLAEELSFKNILLTSGTSFFVLTGNKTATTKASIVNVATYITVNSIDECINDFLLESNVTRDEIDQVLFCSLNKLRAVEIAHLFPQKKIVDYQPYTGIYFTNASFALHLATDILQTPGNNTKRILICNHLNHSNLGLTIVESIEA